MKNKLLKVALQSVVTSVTTVVYPVTAVRIIVTDHPTFTPGSYVSVLLAISPRVSRIVGLLHTHPWGALLPCRVQSADIHSTHTVQVQVIYFYFLPPRPAIKLHICFLTSCIIIGRIFNFLARRHPLVSNFYEIFLRLKNID